MTGVAEVAWFSALCDDDYEFLGQPDPALPKEQDWLRMTQAVIDLYDAAIRAAPEQYFWYNKRWVLDPLPAEAAPEAETPNPNRQIPNKSE